MKKSNQSSIALIGDRLSFLDKELLSQAEIPESVINDVTPRKITIIGGHGRMGKLFKEQFSAVGHHVSVLEHEDWGYAQQLLNSAELVLVSVPIEYTVDVIKRAAKYLAPTTALCDVTSIKIQSTQAMLEYHSGPVMGLHPMFGPNIKSFLGQKFVICPGRNDEAFLWLLDLIKGQGGELIVCTPEEHDRMMVIIQAVQHFCRLSFGIFLAETRINLEQSLLLSTPSYQQQIESIKRLFSQNSHLCVDIMLATEERCEAINSLANTYSRLAKLVKMKDRDALIQEFESIQGFFLEKNKTLVK
ncbi:MAG: prephenate dehydrogenase/arogenate dehydrogenase family protein [Nostoc sp. DedQUE12a]|nr:prephenate dehydrogenase/arogenate dehydrogenase family protein [Nostoc sp. DedQUE12a]